MQWLSPLILRFLHSIVLKTLRQAGKAIASSFMVLSMKVSFCLQCLHGKKHQQWWTFLALLPRKWQGGHLHALNFKKMPEALDRDPFGPVIVKAEVRNTVLYTV